MSYYLILSLSLLVGLMCNAVSAVYSSNNMMTDINFIHKVIAKLPANSGLISVNKETGKYAWLQNSLSGVYVVINGIEYGPYYDADRVEFSPDGNAYAYMVIDKGMFYVMHNDKRYGPYRRKPAPLVFSRDGTKLAYAVWDGTRQHMVLNGKPGKTYDLVYQANFTDSGKLYYAAKNNNKGIMVNGVEETVHEGGVFWPLISDEPPHVAYGIKTGFIFDKKEFSVSGEPGLFSLDHHGGRLAYQLIEENRSSIFVNGKKLRSCEKSSGPVYSDDGNALAFACIISGRSFVVFNDTEIMSDFSDIPATFMPWTGRPQSMITISRNNQHVAWVVKKHNDYFIYHDNMSYGPFSEAGMPVLSASGKYVISPVTVDRRAHMMINSVRSPDFNWVDQPVIDYETNTVKFTALDRDEIVIYTLTIRE